MTPATPIGGSLDPHILGGFASIRALFFVLMISVGFALWLHLRSKSGGRGIEPPTLRKIAMLMTGFGAVSLAAAFVGEWIGPHFVPRLPPDAAVYVVNIPLACLLALAARLLIMLARVLIEDAGFILADRQMAAPLVTIVQLIVVAATCLLVLAIFDIHIEGIVLGASVTGAAFAFAAKDTLSNAATFVMMLADPPFNVGDRVSVFPKDSLQPHVGRRGVVLKVTILHTRLYCDGDILVIANSYFANAIVENHSQST